MTTGRVETLATRDARDWCSTAVYQVPRRVSTDQQTGQKAPPPSCMNVNGTSSN